MPEDRRILCTAQAHVTGWRAEGHGRTSDGALEVDLLALAATRACGRSL